MFDVLLDEWIDPDCVLQFGYIQDNCPSNPAKKKQKRASKKPVAVVGKETSLAPSWQNPSVDKNQSTFSSPSETMFVSHQPPSADTLPDNPESADDSEFGGNYQSADLFGGAGSNPQSAISFGEAGGNPQSVIPFGGAGSNPQSAISFGEAGGNPQSALSFGGAGSNPQSVIPFGEAGGNPQSAISFGEAGGNPQSADSFGGAGGSYTLPVGPISFANLMSLTSTPRTDTRMSMGDLNHYLSHPMPVGIIKPAGMGFQGMGLSGYKGQMRSSYRSSFG
jgi:hypothetical protein